MNKKRGISILFKAISSNFFKIVVYYPKMVYMAFHQSKYTEDEMYAYCLKMITFAIEESRLKVVPYGLENIPEKDGFYICSNHQEKFDPLAIWYTFPRKVGVILDDSVTHRPFIREVCRLIKSQRLLKRNTHSVVKAYSEITKDLKAGLNYMVFPEGGYEKQDGKLGEFMAGSFKSPQRAHCPILPVAIVDSFKIFDKGFKTTNPIQVHYLKPIAPEEYDGMSTTEIAELVKNRIQEHLNIYQK
ncbi:1-acyl-sn-glycerol-3-phosphate acyltransferase [Treponema bryantii]|uniref:1-acyl-sn-glycerol-3-phosphate acyltransferase n=2 Tax=Treponema bryantii TaxID=163 RepID=A0A1H9CUC2_9SPIR|nr:1-acyl-sn-glycerol-3-phosphate acyltransferase [Treponema bryantii]